MAKKKAWGGRFEGSTDRFVEEFTASIPYDVKLYSEDIEGSIAHVRMLARRKIVAKAEAEAIASALARVREEIAAGKVSFSLSDEDVHMAVERRMTKKVG